jgi:class 3 adenylate cyclase
MTAVREERRLVTSMFVDVVGSTELTMRLGAERLKHELGKAFAEISAVRGPRRSGAGDREAGRY